MCATPLFGSSRRRHLRQLVAVLLAGAGTGARALVGGGGLQDPDPNAAWAGVGSLDNGRGGLFTATPLDRHHVITAAHVVAGADVRRVVFRLSTRGGLFIGARALPVHPAFRGMVAHRPSADPTTHHDIAIVRLSEPLPDAVPIPPIFTGDLCGRTLTLVSHGGSTTLVSIGENVADLVLRDDFGRPATYLFDFDGPDLGTNSLGPPLPAHGTLGPRREAALIGGDSGSAAFVHFDGIWWLAGINSFRITFNAPPDASGFGVAGGGVVLGTHTDWIQSVTGAG